MRAQGREVRLWRAIGSLALRRVVDDEIGPSRGVSDFLSAPLRTLGAVTIKWDQLGQPQFDVAVDRLLLAEWGGRPDVSAHSPDGRGWRWRHRLPCHDRAR
ncbi:hypothetical protein B8281_15900 [Cellulosimicrobium sp. TH-20]|nr:hypothetical protein B8281_15900 [Cellulosimicrobium sp. TH-20]